MAELSTVDTSSEPLPSLHASCDYHVTPYRRVIGLLESTKGKIVCGGETDESTRYIAPTVIVDVSPDDQLMQVIIMFQ